MSADDGHNAFLPNYCSPSNPLFKVDLEGQVVWVFPPIELVGITLKFLVAQCQAGRRFRCCILVPDKSSAYWYKHLVNFKPIERFCP